MIGKPEWFQRRKYGGWGLSPKTWQGWAYIIVAILLFALIQYAPLGTQVPLMVVLAIILAGDFADILLHIKKDERERIHEAIAERNALWVVLGVLVIGLAYQTASSAVHGQPTFDPVILIAVVAGVITKAISNIYLERKN